MLEAAKKEEVVGFKKSADYKKEVLEVGWGRVYQTPPSYKGY